MKYKAVLFDLFGTLILMDDLEAELDEWLGRFHECLQPHGLTMPREKFDKVCSSNLWQDISTQIQDDFTIFERRVHAICSCVGLEVMSADIKRTVISLLEVWNKYAVLDPDCHPLLRELRQRHILGLISNFDHPPYIRRILQDLELQIYFSTAVVSGDYDFKKPDPRIFHLALGEIGLKPEDAIYIGDSEEDIVGARAAGIKPVLIQRNTTGKPPPDIFKRDYPQTDVITINSLPELWGLLEE